MSEGGRKGSVWRKRKGCLGLGLGGVQDLASIYSRWTRHVGRKEGD